MSKCLNCGIEIIDKRAGAKYCTDVCRVVYNRNMKVESVTDNTKLVTDNTKRGKDIKCFADLHPGIQQSIDKMSLVDGKIDKTIKTNRTAIAIDYQHKHPDRYHPTGAVFTGSMTVMERLFYRPGQSNFVSLPGWACHGVYQ